MLPSAWALQACVKESVENPMSQPEPHIDIELKFPVNPDFFIGGVLNPVRFKASRAQDVKLRLYNFSQDTLLAEAVGVDEVWLRIPKASIETKYKLLIHQTVFEVTAITTDGESVSLKQYQQQLSEGKTIAIVETNNIPFAFKINADQSFTALDMTCTHNGCPIELDVLNEFKCGCHGSTFDDEGKVTKGPAVDNLRTFRWQYFPIHQVLVVQNK